jgi:hypothetical protein
MRDLAFLGCERVGGIESLVQRLGDAAGRAVGGILDKVGVDDRGDAGGAT